MQEPNTNRLHSLNDTLQHDLDQNNHQKQTVHGIKAVLSEVFKVRLSQIIKSAKSLLKKWTHDFQNRKLVVLTY